MKRTSIVEYFHGETLIYSSVLQIGDSREITSRSRVLAVQRQYELFFGDEGEGNFPIFTMPIPKFQANLNRISIQTLHQSPIISVRSIRVLGASASAVIHIGSTSTVDAEARIKHIRQLAPNSSAPSMGNTQTPTPIVKDEE
ncbi:MULTISPECIES: spore germination protein GerPE [Parageobacillus]|jgi:spore germination protein PE|uniref:Spore gernimation protein n=1 Tax=Parageobacillus thermoglucosidasius TaxID=1426 RepID=A0A1B7KPV2_PARTM|nr:MULTISPECIES: spore germination protein GerPE [Parageobacillus]OAT72040.1 spore gernimation protein [Parageobacillus thermoglucosidasius]BDG48487.1 putative spore germination protein GerPE [Parageobacillus sp. KH3-4]